MSPTTFAGSVQDRVAVSTKSNFLIANLVGAEIAALAVGQPVQVFFQEADGVVVPHCRPAQEAAA